MTLSPIYLKELELVRQEGWQEGRQEARQEYYREAIGILLRLRFGSVDEELNAIIEPLSTLAPSEFLAPLMQLSREELLHRFSKA